MDDSFRRLSLIAAIAALGAGGATAQSPHAQSPHARLRIADLPPRAEAAGTPPSENRSTRAANAPGRPVALPATGATPSSGVRLGLPTEKVSMQLRTPPQAAAASMTVVQLLRHSDQLTHEAELALRRGAVHSSREAAIAALRASAAAADMRTRGREATGALERATTAIREVGDFVGRYGHVDAADLQRMVEAHQTPLLKGCDTTELSPQAAADAYLDFARKRLIEAAGGRREAAASLAVLARVERAHHDVHAELSESVALAYMRAAVGTDLGSAPLANELGYQAMRLGLLDEAQWALERSWAVEPTEAALRNLIETHRLAGDLARARQLVAMLPRFSAEARSDLPEVMRVDPGHFAAISPPVQSPAAATPPGAAARPLGAQPVPRGTQPSAIDGGTAGVRQHNGVTPSPSAEDSPGILGKVAGAMRRMWH